MILSFSPFSRRQVRIAATLAALAAAAAVLAIVPATQQFATACAIATCAVTVAAVVSYKKRAARGLPTRLRGAASFAAQARRAMTAHSYVSSLVVIRVDRHDEIARIHGVERTDAALRTLTRVIQRSAGDRAVVARIGDEFAALLSTATAAEALLAAARIHRALLLMRESIPLAGLDLTVSIGVASGRGGLEDLRTGAHWALRAATQKGGNRTSSLQDVSGAKLGNPTLHWVSESPCGRRETR